MSKTTSKNCYKNNKESLSFENAIKELDQIVEKINGDSVTIDQMVTLFERGIFLNNHCKDILDTAKGKIYELVKNNKSFSLDELK